MNKWTVVLAHLDPVVGSEQAKIRTVIIVSETQANKILPVANVSPVTSRKGSRPLYSNEALLPLGSCGLSNESIALAYQIRTLDKQRFSYIFGELKDQKVQTAIQRAVKRHLGI